MKDVKQAVLLVVLAVAVLMPVSLVGWAWMYSTAEIRGRAGAEVKLESADSRISNYDHFYDLCAAVQGYEQSIISQRAALASGGNPEMIQINLAGLAAQRARAIAQYNADANKAYTKARFLGDNLPRRLDAALENTQCD